jgi:hypothetical protein
MATLVALHWLYSYSNASFLISRGKRKVHELYNKPSLVAKGSRPHCSFLLKKKS